jgi:hypothetical protein
MKIKNKKSKSESVTLLSANSLSQSLGIVIALNAALTGSEFLNLTKDSHLLNQMRTVTGAITTVMCAFGIGNSTLIKKEREKLGDLGLSEGRNLYMPESDEEEEMVKALLSNNTPNGKSFNSYSSLKSELPPVDAEGDVLDSDYEGLPVLIKEDPSDSEISNPPQKSDSVLGRIFGRYMG